MRAAPGRIYHMNEPPGERVLLSISFAPAGALYQSISTGGRALRACPRLFSFAPSGADIIRLVLQAEEDQRVAHQFAPCLKSAYHALHIPNPYPELIDSDVIEKRG
jgi:hypothetical protein